jgi:hypothetical protein
MKSRHSRSWFGIATVSLIATLGVVLETQPPPAHALPTFARQNGMSCNSCHSIAPKLTLNGLAFQANYFNWPGGSPHLAKGLDSIPLSGLMTTTWGNSQNAPTGAQFQALELFAAGGFNPYGEAGHGGGYWFDYLAASNDGTRPSFLDGAWVAVPLVGSHGQLSMRIGQFSPINYQWDGIATLTQTLPSALTDPIDNIALDASTPAVSLEYFSNRGQRTANGLYIDAGMPLGGHITLNQESRLYGPQGAYVHVFVRHGYNTRGVFAFRNGSATQEGLILTRQFTPQLSVLGIGAVGGDVGGNQQHLSAEADYVVSTSLAFSAQYDYIRGVVHDQYPVLTLSWYPASQHVLRLTGQSVLDGGNRSNTIFALVQF